MLLDEDEGAEGNIQNAILSEKVGLQKEEKEISIVASDSDIEPGLKRETGRDLTEDSVVDNKQKVILETESSNVEITETVSKEIEEKDIQDKKTGKEILTEGVKEITELQGDNKCDESALKEPEGQKNEVIFRNEESLAKRTDKIQEQVTEGTCSAPEAGGVGESRITDADKMHGNTQKPTENIVEETWETAPSLPSLIKSEGTVMDSQPQPIVGDRQDPCETSAIKETEVGILEKTADLEQRPIESDTEHNQETERTEESNNGYVDKVGEPDNTPGTTPEENHSNNIQIGTDLSPGSSDAQLKPDSSADEQPCEHELSPIPNISISCADKEIEDKLSNQGNVENSQHLDPQNAKENDADSGTGSTADNSSIDLNLSISSFLSKNKDGGSISLQVRVNHCKCY